MFDNLLFQPAKKQLTDDVVQGVLPHAVLFSGPACSGKLTAALELARVLSCSSAPTGNWTCTCPSCLKHKALVSPSVLITGSKNCTLEIAAASRTLLSAASSNASCLGAARYLFLRSVRKLTLRFNPLVWEGDDKVPKISPIITSLDELLEELDPSRPLPEYSRLEKLCASLLPLCEKLEGGFLYDSIPVAHIRRACSWAHYHADMGKKILIIENADRLQESVRNALLKTLEEPPADTLFILTTTRRTAVMPTILSRVRVYHFADRSRKFQQEVLRRVFHTDITGTGASTGNRNISGAVPAVSAEISSGLPVCNAAGSNLPAETTIDSFLQSFLPVHPSVAAEAGAAFVAAVASGKQPDIDGIIKQCSGFEPRLLFTVFLKSIAGMLRNAAAGAVSAASSEKDPVVAAGNQFFADSVQPVSAGQISGAAQIRSAEMAAAGVAAVNGCASHVSVYNQSISSALELLASDLSLMFRKYGGGIIL